MFPQGSGGSTPPSGTITPMAEERAQPPSFRRLLASNLKVVAATAVLALVAYGVWRGLAVLFPETAWLQPKR